MADPTATAGVTDADKSPDRIEREMEQTRESITQKVAALETQVLGTIQTATTTLTDTVQTVKETVTTAPTAVKETVAAMKDSVKDSVKETFTSVKDAVASFNVSDCIRENPGMAVGTSAAFGFLTGYLLLGGHDSRPLMARGYREPAPNGRPGTVPPDTAHHFAGYAATPTEPARPGMFTGLMAMVGGELEQLAKQALSTALASLKQSVNEKVPRLMDDAVQNLANRVTGQEVAGDGGRARGGAYPTTGF
ncbi:DUF3618 domain-containing protein [bacterium]|nr:DUF3618 domain-containing protein [bacterium]